MKTSLSRLRTEAKQLEIRIGVVTHTLVAKKLKQNITTRCIRAHGRCHSNHSLHHPHATARHRDRQEAAIPKNNHIQQDAYMDDLEDE